MTRGSVSARIQELKTKVMELSPETMLTEGAEKTARIELFLLCAAQDILEKTKKARGAVFFSATLAPFEAAKRMLGSLDGDACLALPSPFDKSQLDAYLS